MFKGKTIVTIYSGEYYISKDPQVIIYTLLGSCIAVCLYDNKNRIGGMNHFMLPQAMEDPIIDQGRYGLQSIESMLEELCKQGAVYSNLKAKVFGGSNMFGLNFTVNNIAILNRSFILQYLERKKIPIVAKELGGYTGRKIYYDLADHSVYVQRLSREGNNSYGSKPTAEH